MPAITLEQTEIDLLAVRLEIAKAQQMQSFSRSSGSSAVAQTSANLEALYKERDRLQLLFDRLSSGGTTGIRMRGVTFL
jgi:hypothetical protein